MRDTKNDYTIIDPKRNTNEAMLPHDARGMDFDMFAFEFRPDGKIHFFPKSGNGSHYTIHPGNKSGILDVHKTYMMPDGTKKHETIFAMKNEDIPRLLLEIGPIMISALEGLRRPLSLGWLKHRNITIVYGLYPSDTDFAKITKRNSHKRLDIDNNAFQNNVYVPEYLEEIYDMEDGAFSLISIRRRKSKHIGVAFKTTLLSGDIDIFWIKLKDLPRMMKRMEPILIQEVKKYQLSREEFSKYLPSE